MKKKLLFGLSLATVVAATVGVTYSVLTSQTPVTVNTMTTGKAEIEQLEYQRVVDANGEFVANPDHTTSFASGTYIPDELEEFQNDKLMVPISVDSMKWDDRNGSSAATGNESWQQPWAQIGAPGSNQLFDADISNVIDKFVFVKNTGDVPVYFRTVIAIEAPEDNTGTIGTNLNGNSKYDWNQTIAGNQYDSDSLGHELEGFYADINGTRYYVRVATHTEALEKDSTARPSLLQLYLSKDTTNDDMDRFGETIDVLVMSQAVQVGAKADEETGRSAAQVGLEEAFGRITAENVADLFPKTNE